MVPKATKAVTAMFTNIATKVLVISDFFSPSIVECASALVSALREIFSSTFTTLAARAEASEKPCTVAYLR